MIRRTVEHENPYGRDSVRRGIFHYLTGRTLSGIASFISIVLLARHMDIESYAGYAALTGVIMMAAALGDLGINPAIARYVPELRVSQPIERLSGFIWWTSLLRLSAVALCTAALYWIWPLIPRLFQSVRLPQFPWSLACYLVANVLFQHFSTILQALVQQKMLAQIMAIQWAGRLLLILLLIHLYFSISVRQALWVMAIPELGGAVAILVFIQRHLSRIRAAHQLTYTVMIKATPPQWRTMATLALHNYAYNLMTAPPQGYFMRMMVAALLPAPVVASYGFFTSLVERARRYLPARLIYNLAEPVIVANYIRDRDVGKLVQRAQLLYKINLLVVMPLLAIALVSGTDIARVLVADKFLAYAWLLALLLVQLVIGNHMMPIRLLVNTLGASDVLTKSGLVSLIGMTISTALIIAWRKPLALVFTPLVYAAINNLTALFLVRRNGYKYSHPTSFLTKLTLIFATACITMRIVIGSFESTPWPHLLAASATSVTVFFGGYVLLKILDIADTRTLRLLLPKRNLSKKATAG